MPVLKPISGHTSCQNIQRYLEKGGRALAHDYFNLSWDEREDDDDEELKSEVCWADEMDELRRLTGNDKPFGGKHARTYKHFVLSPDPEDHIDLAALRELTCAWAIKHFGEYQVAIVYHNDNASSIPHAHIVVNNTNLVTGRRLQTQFPLELNRDLQEMSRERELSFLTDNPEPIEGLERLSAKKQEHKAKPRTMQQVYIGRAERELEEVGKYSWVADIRNRVSVAKSLARNEGEFRQVLEMLGVDISDNSRAARRDDWVYALSDTPTRRVSGERLGLLFAKETIQRELKRANTYRPDAKSSRELLRNARNAILVNDLGDLGELSSALRTCAYHNASSLQDCDRKIEALKRRAESSEGRERAALEANATALKNARNYMAARNLLPEHIGRRHSASTNASVQAPSRSAERTSHTNQPDHARQIARQQESADRRDAR
ncbi:relaxase/mobilization nuclease domain-containing protein [Adlercreutzia sp. ZJ138]|uniref:relaxase/mobilization nuclease domain-containing protein n=1 Tax=Adlercreutzia sp. ZJ138 TaxID=2709405 RepID=UPI0013EBA3C8|nr:relaxase/mobilization nuclease domain-containing protein [Adlercreutzia sp. ZJ138]